jgi:hypothetical protein
LISGKPFISNLSSFDTKDNEKDSAKFDDYEEL